MPGAVMRCGSRVGAVFHASHGRSPHAMYSPKSGYDARRTARRAPAVSVDVRRVRPVEAGDGVLRLVAVVREAAAGLAVDRAVGEREHRRRLAVLQRRTQRDAQLRPLRAVLVERAEDRELRERPRELALAAAAERLVVELVHPGQRALVGAVDARAERAADAHAVGEERPVGASRSRPPDPAATPSASSDGSSTPSSTMRPVRSGTSRRT